MVYIVEMAWGRPQQLVVYGLDEDGELGPQEIIPDTDPDPEWRFFQCHGSEWKDVLKLAEEHGWTPSGTVPGNEQSRQEWERSGGFDSSYKPVDWLGCKLVTAADAAAMANALEKAVKGHEVAVATDSPQPVLIRKGTTRDEFADANRGMSKKFLSEFITFLRKGQFRFAYDD